MENLSAKQKRSAGDGKIYMGNRLKRDRPDLWHEVEKGKLSINAAAIRAGWRKPKMTVMVDTSDNAINYLLKRFSKDELFAAIERAP